MASRAANTTTSRVDVDGVGTGGPLLARHEHAFDLDLLCLLHERTGVAAARQTQVAEEAASNVLLLAHLYTHDIRLSQSLIFTSAKDKGVDHGCGGSDP